MDEWILNAICERGLKEVLTLNSKKKQKQEAFLGSVRRQLSHQKPSGCVMAAESKAL